MTFRRRRPVLPLIAAGLTLTALAGCSTTPRTVAVEPAAVPVAQGVEGQWLSADGSSATSFLDGTFQTAALDTGKTLAEGAYAMADDVSVDITMRSLIRGKTSKVNCLLVHSGQLNCTTQDRRQFVLTRAPAPALAFL